jgi:triosephosphate isomerase
MRTPFVVGNWKLNKTIAEALALVTELKNQLGAVKGVAIGVAPPFTALNAVAKRLEGSPIATCAQDCHWEASGAWTGEVSAAQVGDAGASWVIVGHSERRQFFGDTNDCVGKKARAVLAAGLGAIVCIGESLAERDAGTTLAVIDDQLAGALAGIAASAAAKLVLAYEPVWAIGTGRVATPEDAQEVCGALRARLAERFGPETAAVVRILYGGSVKAANTGGILAGPDIDGALVGGASLDADEFVQICRTAAGGS